MKKVNLTIIATIIATFVVSMFAFQPTTIEASNGAVPSSTRKPGKVRTVPNNPQQPAAKITPKKPAGWSWGESNAGSTKRTKPIQSSVIRKSSTKRTRRTPTGKFFDSPKFDQDSGLEFSVNKNVNEQPTTRKSKSKSNSGKRVHKP